VIMRRTILFLAFLVVGLAVVFSLAVQ